MSRPTFSEWIRIPAKPGEGRAFFGSLIVLAVFAAILSTPWWLAIPGCIGVAFVIEYLWDVRDQ